jgi:hypothetical protein
MVFFQAPPTAQVRRDFAAHRLLSRRRAVDDQRQEFGCTVAINRLLFHNELAAAHVPTITVFSNAFVVELELIARNGELDTKAFVYGPSVRAALQQHDGELPPGLFRFGIGFADGRRAASFDEWAEREAADRLVMYPTGGGGGGGRWQQGYRVQSLPPPGPVMLVVEWPAGEVPETVVTVDAAVLLEAAATVETLWPPDPPDPPPAAADVEAVFLASVLTLLGPSMLAVSGIRLRGARLDGRHPDTELVVDYHDLDADHPGLLATFALWQGTDHLDLAHQDPERAAADVRNRILERRGP